jgi:hypothetical protein
MKVNATMVEAVEIELNLGSSGVSQLQDEEIHLNLEFWN